MTDSEIETEVSKIFQAEFAASSGDMGCRLEAARDAASRSVPAGRTGSFDDSSLSFAIDGATMTDIETEISEFDIDAHRDEIEELRQIELDERNRAWQELILIQKSDLADECPGTDSVES